MNIYKWTLIALFILNAMAVVLSIGEERKPITPASALFIILANVAMGVLVVMA